MLLQTVLNNMSQGVLMFDSETRLIFCNQRYIELYGLSPEIVKPGCHLIDLIKHRIELGSFSGDPDRIRCPAEETVLPKERPSTTLSTCRTVAHFPSSTSLLRAAVGWQRMKTSPNASARKNVSRTWPGTTR